MSTAVWVVIAILVVGGIVIAALGWDRYRGDRDRKGADKAAQPTNEVFVDPDTGRRMRVWFDPGTGRRDYRPDQPGPARTSPDQLGPARNRPRGPPGPDLSCAGDER